jgi:protein-S-isoprenylcysteine O-methyltransferase Ste14
MTAIDRFLLVRAASIYLAAVATMAIWIWRRPGTREMTGALFAVLWNLPVLLVLNVIAIRAGWWQFDARGGLLLGVPVDLYLSWAWLWGVVPALAFPSASLIVMTIVALVVDLVLMPAAAPVLRLGPLWLIGEAVALGLAFVPGQLLARWTIRDERLTSRVVLLVGAFSGILIVMLPAIAIEGSGGSWSNPFDRPAWQISLLAQVLALPAVIGLSAVQEFATHGRGTPVPYDPPRHLVTTGVYRYVRNPMQASATLLLLLLGLILKNPWVAAAGLMAHIYSVGLAGWDEDEDLRARFGDAWTIYRANVRSWLPRFRAWHPPGNPPARLFVSEKCGMCSEVGRWFASRGARHLEIIAAERHPSRRLTRITYEAGGGSVGVSGVEAIARALEHIHAGWAFIGALMRLPIMCQCLQVLVDASGGEPRSIGAAGLKTRAFWS